MKVTCDYDDNADVLYLSFDGAEEAISYERNIPVLIRYNPGTDRVSGITILNLKEINIERGVENSCGQRRDETMKGG